MTTRLQGGKDSKDVGKDGLTFFWSRGVWELRERGSEGTGRGVQRGEKEALWSWVTGAIPASYGEGVGRSQIVGEVMGGEENGVGGLWPERQTTLQWKGVGQS